MPVTAESGIDTPDVASHFRGAWTLCFYVPRGTKIVGGWAARVASRANLIAFITPLPLLWVTPLSAL